MAHTYTLMTNGQQEWTTLHPRKQQTYPIQAVQQWKYYKVHFILFGTKVHYAQNMKSDSFWIMNVYCLQVNNVWC